MATATSQRMMLAQVAQYFNRKHPGAKLQAHHIRRLYLRCVLPEPERFAGYRVVNAKDLPAIEKALRRVGYLTTPAEGA